MIVFVMPYHFVSKWVGPEKTTKEDTCFFREWHPELYELQKERFFKKTKRGQFCECKKK